MISEEKCKESLIGQQLMAIQIIKAEKKKVANGGFSFVGVDELTQWMGCKKEDAEKLFHYYTLLVFCGCFSASTFFGRAHPILTIFFAFFFQKIKKAANR